MAQWYITNFQTDQNQHYQQLALCSLQEELPENSPFQSMQELRSFLKLPLGNYQFHYKHTPQWYEFDKKGLDTLDWRALAQMQLQGRIDLAHPAVKTLHIKTLTDLFRQLKGLYRPLPSTALWQQHFGNSSLTEGFTAYVPRFPLLPYDIIRNCLLFQDCQPIEQRVFNPSNYNSAGVAYDRSALPAFSTLQSTVWSQWKEFVAQLNYESLLDLFRQIDSWGPPTIAVQSTRPVEEFINQYAEYFGRPDETKQTEALMQQTEVADLLAPLKPEAPAPGNPLTEKKQPNILLPMVQVLLEQGERPYEQLPSPYQSTVRSLPVIVLFDLYHNLRKTPQDTLRSFWEYIRGLHLYTEKIIQFCSPRTLNWTYHEQVFTVLLNPAVASSRQLTRTLTAATMTRLRTSAHTYRRLRTESTGGVLALVDLILRQSLQVMLPDQVLPPMTLIQMAFVVTADNLTNPTELITAIRQTIREWMDPAATPSPALSRVMEWSQSLQSEQLVKQFNELITYATTLHKSKVVEQHRLAMIADGQAVLQGPAGLTHIMAEEYKLIPVPEAPTLLHVGIVPSETALFKRKGVDVFLGPPGEETAMLRDRLLQKREQPLHRLVINQIIERAGGPAPLSVFQKELTDMDRILTIRPALSAELSSIRPDNGLQSMTEELQQYFARLDKEMQSMITLHTSCTESLHCCSLVGLLEFMVAIRNAEHHVLLMLFVDFALLVLANIVLDTPPKMAAVRPYAIPEPTAWLNLMEKVCRHRVVAGSTLLPFLELYTKVVQAPIVTGVQTEPTHHMRLLLVESTRVVTALREQYVVELSVLRRRFLANEHFSTPIPLDRVGQWPSSVQQKIIQPTAIAVKQKISQLLLSDKKDYTEVKESYLMLGEQLRMPDLAARIATQEPTNTDRLHTLYTLWLNFEQTRQQQLVESIDVVVSATEDYIVEQIKASDGSPGVTIFFMDLAYFGTLSGLTALANQHQRVTATRDRITAYHNEVKQQLQQLQMRMSAYDNEPFGLQTLKNIKDCLLATMQHIELKQRHLQSLLQLIDSKESEHLERNHVRVPNSKRSMLSNLYGFIFQLNRDNDWQVTGTNHLVTDAVLLDFLANLGGEKIKYNYTGTIVFSEQPTVNRVSSHSFEYRIEESLVQFVGQIGQTDPNLLLLRDHNEAVASALLSLLHSNGKHGVIVCDQSSAPNSILVPEQDFTDLLRGLARREGPLTDRHLPVHTNNPTIATRTVLGTTTPKGSPVIHVRSLRLSDLVVPTKPAYFTETSTGQFQITDSHIKFDALICTLRRLRIKAMLSGSACPATDIWETLSPELHFGTVLDLIARRDVVEYSPLPAQKIYTVEEEDYVRLLNKTNEQLRLENARQTDVITMEMKPLHYFGQQLQSIIDVFKSTSIF
jgi:hypothetical protein